MLMRKIPLRGEQFRLLNGVTVTFLEQNGNLATVIMPSQKTLTVPIDDLGLLIIDTKYYEKIQTKTA